jgi:hypothetical protein
MADFERQLETLARPGSSRHAITDASAASSRPSSRASCRTSR